MRLSVCMPLFFRDMPIEDAVRGAAALGFDAVEMWRLPKDMDLEKVAEACRTCGVEFVAFCPDRFNMTAEADREPYLESLRAACENANVLGAHKLITQVGPDTGAPRQSQHANIVRCLSEAAVLLASYGVTLVIEPLNLLVDHPGYYLPTSAEGFEIVREVGSPNVRLLFDVYHQQISEGNIIPNITENVDLIAHMHAAGHPGRHELQFGESDYRNIFAAADAAGYRGVCGLEYKPTLDPVESLREAKRLYGEA